MVFILVFRKYGMKATPSSAGQLFHLRLHASEITSAFAHEFMKLLPVHVSNKY